VNENNASHLAAELLRSARVGIETYGTGSPKTVILAGGKGTRLKPYTSVLPKPLMPLGDQAILEIVVRQLARQGLTDITLSVGHLAHLIEAVFGNGCNHGVEITYVREDTPLGTAGSLRLVGDLSESFLMLNGDIVTTLDYREFVRLHRASGNLLTIATKARQVEIDYGVLSVETGSGQVSRVVHIDEKPKLDFIVSMGIYVLEPEVLDFIPAHGYFDFPNLVERLLREDAPVGAYEYNGLWLDIGRHEDYQEAVTLLDDGELAILDSDPSSSVLTSS
jgi:NDP-sugar pyrophosphorylase family protein